MILTVNSTTPAGRVRPWIWVAALGAAATIGVGASLLAAPAAPDAAPTASEAALSRAHDDASLLAAAAGLLAGQGPSTAPAAAARTAEVLRRQASVLAASLPASGRASRVASPASATPAPSAQTAPPAPTPAALAGDLAASATTRLADLAAVDGPTAALLASLAAGQTIEAGLLAQSAGVPAPVTPSAPSTGPTACPSTSSPRHTPSRSTPPSTSILGQAEALSAAQSAEQAAVWTYTVLAARTDTAARAGNLAAAELHRAQLRALDAVARAACTDLAAPAAGFALPADAGSPGELVLLEGSATAAWSDLVGAAEPPIRAAAATGLVEAARRSAAVGALVSAESGAFPGHSAAQAAALAAAQASASPSPTR